MIMARDFEVKLAGVTLDARDPKALMKFYSELLGWEINYESEGYCSLAAPGGGTALGAQLVETFKKPVWPPAEGCADTAEHCDFQVTDREAAVALSLKLGASRAEQQFIENLTVMIDPEGHPYCLFEGGE